MDAMTQEPVEGVNQLKWQMVAGGLILLIVLGLCGGLWWWQGASRLVYPVATAEQMGNCGSWELSRHGKTFKLEEYYCYTTADSGGDVLFWYGTQGYEYRNQGRALHEHQDLYWFYTSQIERVYVIPSPGDETFFRVYRDSYVRLP